LLSLRSCCTFASSGAGLVALAILVGGDRAIELLTVAPGRELLLGAGSSASRRRTARTLLAELGADPDTTLGDLLSLRRHRLSLVAFDDSQQAPTLLGLHAEHYARAPLADVLAAMCSVNPVEIGGTRTRLLDVQQVVSPEAVAAALHPNPFFVIAPSETMQRSLPPCVAYAAHILGLHTDVAMARCTPADVAFLRAPTPNFFVETAFSMTTCPLKCSLTEPLAQRTLDLRKAFAAVVLLLLCNRLLALLGSSLGLRLRLGRRLRC
jgi:hypothetical protein